MESTAVTESPLLSLPRELRDQIYHYAVIEPYPIKTAINSRLSADDSRWLRSLRRPQPPLALACRLLHNEVLPIYYAENVFKVNRMADRGITWSWLHRIMHPQLHLMNHFVMTECICYCRFQPCTPEKHLREQCYVKVSLDIRKDGGFAICHGWRSQRHCACKYQDRLDAPLVCAGLALEARLRAIDVGREALKASPCRHSGLQYRTVICELCGLKRICYYGLA